MKKIFTYSILQYKHSLALGEALNVGILFAFPETQKLEFVYGSSTRVKSVYPNFDSIVFNHLLKNIETRLKNRATDLFAGENLKRGVVDFIHSQILREDSTSLQFQEPSTVINTFDSNERAVKEFSRLLLPGIIVEKKEITRHTEDFIIKKYTSYIFDKHPNLEAKFERNPVIKTNHLSLKFDLSWQNGTLNIIKAISFDLVDKTAIQTKGINNFGALTALKEYAYKENIKFNLLISEPQHQEFYVPYKDALKLIDSVDIDKEIIPSNRIEKYSQATIEYFTRNN